MPRPRLSFILVGGAPIVTHCGETILSRGHAVLHVIARSDFVEQWAHGHGLSVSSGSEADAAAPVPHADHIISAANDLILSPALLARAQKGAYNLHNSLLPSYRGAFAASWAILDGQPLHGATWHAMESAIDAGNAIARKSFPIQREDTARSLNARCMEAGWALFRDAVLPRLEASLYANGPIAEGPYFPVAQRAPFVGLIDWRRTAEDCLRVVRALDRGPIDNSFDLAKLLAGGRCWAIAEAKALPEMRLAQGQLLPGNDGEALLGTTSGAISLSGLIACGMHTDIAAPLQPQQLHLPSGDWTARAEALGRMAAKAENAAIRRWRDAAGAEDLEPVILTGLTETRTESWEQIASLLSVAMRQSPHRGTARIAVQTPSMLNVPPELAPLFSSCQPFILDPAEPATRLAQRLQQVDDAGPVLIDVWLRRTALRDMTVPRSALRIFRSTDSGGYAIFTSLY